VSNEGLKMDAMVIRVYRVRVTLFEAEREFSLMILIHKLESLKVDGMVRVSPQLGSPYSKRSESFTGVTNFG
jgi:hypothetical protein